MEHHRPDPDLPAEWSDALRALGPAEAPPELEERVLLARLGEGLRAEAPAELWSRTLVALRREQGLPAPAAPPGRIFVLPLLARRLAVAAALLLFLGAGMLLPGGPERTSSPLEAGGARVALRNHYLGRVVAVQTDPVALSPTARGLAGRLSASLSGGRSL